MVFPPHVVTGWRAPTGEAMRSVVNKANRSVVNELILFSSISALFMGIVLTTASLVG